MTTGRKKKKKERKILILQEADRQLLLHLHDFIFLSLDFIGKHIYDYQKKTSLYRRLSELEKADYVRSYTLPAKHDDSFVSKVFTLSKHGAECVHELRGVSHWKDKWSQGIPPLWYMHQIMISEVVKSFELHSSEEVNFREWIPEERAHFETIDTTGKKAVIRPDGILTLGAGDSKGGLGVLLEMERSYSTRERTLRKIDQYNYFFERYDKFAIAYDRSVGFETLPMGWKILFVGDTEAKTDKLLRDLEKENSVVPVLVACKERIEQDPFGPIYREPKKPEEYRYL